MPIEIHPRAISFRQVAAGTRDTTSVVLLNATSARPIRAARTEEGADADARILRPRDSAWRRDQADPALGAAAHCCLRGDAAALLVSTGHPESDVVHHRAAAPLDARRAGRRWATRERRRRRRRTTRRGASRVLPIVQVET